MELEQILKNVENYYEEKVKKHGATALGVDWNSSKTQALRFQQLLKICNNSVAFSINDYGCGYGALVGYMLETGYSLEYQGFDIVPDMIYTARKIYGGLDNCSFLGDASLLTKADYTIASGIFNVKLNTDESTWKEYILDTLSTIDKLSKKGFAFNMLTKYSDRDKMRPDLYYADPLYLFDYCKNNFSKYVSILHDYPLYEFTILVKH